MSFKKSILLAGALALSVFAAPIPECSEDATQSEVPASTPALTAANLIAIASTTASCDGAPYPEECKDATAAAAALNKAFETYKITSTEEQAAVVAYELFESANFKYNKNKFPAPGRPGQGTRMMAMPPVVQKYATAVAGAAAVATAQAAGGDTGLNAVLALVNSDDEKSFGSAAWFVTSECTPAVRAGLQAGTIDGWHSFLTACVQTSLDDARDTIWVTAKQIMLGD
ncbi:hypothetical protein ACN47E_002897 [Coniothyrium glycines]